MLRLLILFVLIAVSPLVAYAEDSRWLVLTEVSSLDKAVGTALAHRFHFGSVRVHLSGAGVFAAIAGPIEKGKTNAEALSVPEVAGSLPSGVQMLSETDLGPKVWTLYPDGVVDLRFREGGALRFANQYFEVSISAEVDLTDQVVKPILTLVQDGEIVYRTSMTEYGADASAARLRVLWLDRTANAPQIVFSAYTMGARCCTVTTILSRTDTGWREFDGGWLHGAEGYRVEDVDGDGQYELISYDERFLEVFAPHAHSWMPVRVHRLTEGRLLDASHQPDYSAAHRRELASLEHHAELDPELWSEPGFLAGWAALSSILGKRSYALAHLLPAEPRQHDERSYSICDTELVNGECPQKPLSTSSFLKALQAHLVRTGYWR